MRGGIPCCDSSSVPDLFGGSEYLPESNPKPSFALEEWQFLELYFGQLPNSFIDNYHNSHLNINV